MENQFYSEKSSLNRKMLFLVWLSFGMLCLGSLSAHPPVRGVVVTRGAVVATTPRGATWVSFGGTRYAYHGGVYYRPSGRGYVVVSPPLGFRLRVLPAGCVTIYVDRHPYYYYAGTYYILKGEDYVVVQPPVGALVEFVPKGGKEFVIEGNSYYEVDGVQYQAVLHDGAVWYKVIKVKG